MADVLAHAREVAAYATDSDDTRYCQSVLVALADRLAAAEKVVATVRGMLPAGPIYSWDFQLWQAISEYDKATVAYKGGLSE